MSYVRKVVGKDEKVVGIARLHWIYIVQGILWFVGSTATAYLMNSALDHVLSYLPSTAGPTAVRLMSVTSWVMPFAMFFGALICSLYVVKVLTTEVGLTSRRIIYKTGWLFVNVKEIDIEEIRGENLDMGYLGSVLNYAYISLDCRFIGDVTLPAIEKATAFIKALHKMRSEVSDTVSLVVGDKTIAMVEDATTASPGLHHETPSLQKDEHLDQTQVIAMAVAEAMQHMPAAPAAPVPPGTSAPTATIDSATMAAIVEQVVPAMAESMARKISEQVTEQMAVEMEAKGIEKSDIIPVPADMEIPSDAPTPETDPLSDPSRLEPEGPDEELLQKFDDAAGLDPANENKPHPDQPHPKQLTK